MSSLWYSELLGSLGEPEVCKKFGCGRHLTIEERRYGGLCVEHKKINNVNLYDLEIFKEPGKDIRPPGDTDAGSLLLRAS
jgi:hypothetical protein